MSSFNGQTKLYLHKKSDEHNYHVRPLNEKKPEVPFPTNFLNTKTFCSTLLSLQAVEGIQAAIVLELKQMADGVFIQNGDGERREFCRSDDILPTES